MESQQNKALVHEIMSDLSSAITKLLPRAWTRHWEEPDVDAEALILGLGQTLEGLAMHVDTLVFKVQSEQIEPEAAIKQVQDQVIRAIHQMVPGVEVKQRAWQTPRIGSFIQLAEYQLTIEHLLEKLSQIALRIAPEPTIQHFPAPSQANARVAEDLAYNSLSAPEPEQIPVLMG